MEVKDLGTEFTMFVWSKKKIQVKKISSNSSLLKATVTDEANSYSLYNKKYQMQTSKNCEDKVPWTLSSSVYMKVTRRNKQPKYRNSRRKKSKIADLVLRFDLNNDV